MNKILIRSGVSPFNPPKIEDLISQNLIGGNVGNLIYAYSIYRTLMVSDDVEFIPNEYKNPMDKVDYVNENCSMYMMPLADAFREDGSVPELQRMTRFIKKLKIPCVINGVGLKLPLGEDLDQTFSFDEAVKNYVFAVLDKSAMIGVRGENTGAYLKRFGLKEDKDYMIIGCPSMYMYGEKLPKHPDYLNSLNLGEESRIAVTCSHICPQNSYDLSADIMDRYPKAEFFPQRLVELRLIYSGRDMDDTPRRPKGYPLTMEHPYYKEGRVRMFVDAHAWIEYLKEMNLSIGSRFHGSVASMLAGIPSIIICHDNRMKELTEYHKIPHFLAQELPEDIRFEDLIEKLDFEEMFKAHGKNYRRYKEFLKINGVPSIFDQSDYMEETPFDRAIKKMPVQDPIKPANEIDRWELVRRWNGLFDSRTHYQADLLKKMGKEKEVLRTELAETRAKKEEAEKQLKLLNESSISRDSKRLVLAVKDKVRGRNRNNYDRAVELEKR